MKGLVGRKVQWIVSTKTYSGEVVAVTHTIDGWKLLVLLDSALLSLGYKDVAVLPIDYVTEIR